MNRYLSRIILPGIILFFTHLAYAQTCRVNAGSTVEGMPTFIEVFEYDFVTVKPSFPGGDCNLLSFINKERKYPAEAYKRGVQGKVVCSFVVNRDGSISYVKVLRGVEPSLNREAVRILSRMPLWKPGRLDGEPVPVRVVRTVVFRK